MSAILDRFSGRNPLDDPMVAEWDSIVLGRVSTVDDIDPSTAKLLRRFQKLDPGPFPATNFFDRLENQLIRMATPKSTAQGPATATPAIPVQLPTPIRRQARPAGTGAHRRWTPLRIAAAALIVFVLVCVLFLDQGTPPRSEPLPAIPVAQSYEPVLSAMFEFDATSSTIGGAEPATWTDLSASVQKVEPGASFTISQPWYTYSDGPLMLMVLDGALDIRVAGPALFYAAGTKDPPRTVQPGEQLHLAPDDAVVYSNQDGASGSNPGENWLVAFVGTAGRNDDSVTGSVLFPAHVDVASLHHTTSPPNLTGNGTTIVLDRLRLAPLDTYMFDPDPAWRYLVTFDPAKTRSLRVFDGVLGSFDPSGGHASWKLQALGEGPHTLANLGEEPIDLYFMVVEEDSDAGSPPA